MKAQLLSMNWGETAAFLEGLGEKRFRAKQVEEWLLRGAEFSQMSNLPEALRQRLQECAVAQPVEIVDERVSKLDGTRKFLYALGDDNLIEGVLMRYHHGATLCLSTQVGCKMGCAFCASTLEGCVRDLTPGEMLGQIVCANAALAAEGAKVHNVVLMGSGEPLDNYENVVKFLRLATDEAGLNLSARAISLSTCGLVEKMRAFAGEGLPVTLSVSLHAPNDEIRRQLMPVARRYAIDEVLDACKEYIARTGRRVVFEYAMARGINSSLRCADELADRLRGMQCHVNLIPLNAVAESPLQPPTAAEVEAFLQRLGKRRISATRRREMGDDIQGACGQLRKSVLTEAKGSQAP